MTKIKDPCDESAAERCERVDEPENLAYLDDPAYIAHCEEMEKDYEEQVAAGGLLICPKCKRRTLRERVFSTRQYGGGSDTTVTCEGEGCDYSEVYV